MKITTNFVHPAQRTVVPVAAAMWAGAVVLAAVTVWLAVDAVGLRSELPQLHTRLERLGAQKAVAAVTLPPKSELDDVRDRVARVNAVAQTKGMSALALLAELERQLPRDAWLTSVHHRATEGEVQLVAAASRTDPLSEFLLRLEHDPLFEEAMLVREVQAAGSQGVQYEIRLKVRP